MARAVALNTGLPQIPQAKSVPRRELEELLDLVNRGVWGAQVLPKTLEEQDQNPAQIDYSELPKLKTKKHLLEGYRSPGGGVEVIKVKEIPESRLKLERVGRALASSGAIGLNLWSAVELVYFGTKLFFSSLLGARDIDENYRGVGKSLTKLGFSGVLLGTAHESLEWAVGNAGMAFFGKNLEKWLPIFSIFDGVASIGMGKVRYREKQNAFAVQHSIFNNSFLGPLSFLQPTEQAVIAFFRDLTNVKSLFADEPYKCFKRTGGGLVTAGGILGIGQLFKDKLPEKLQSLPYLFYSIFSSANLVALFRDGKMVLKRINAFAAGRKSEDIAQRVEGHLKKAAVPFLGINNLLLGLKGLGVDSSEGVLFNLANSFRTFGIAAASLAFSAQTVMNFLKTMKLGPLIKEVVQLKINPSKALKSLFDLTTSVKTSPLTEEDKLREKQTKEFISELVTDKLCGKQLGEIIELKIFQALKGKSQVGFTSLSDPHSLERLKLTRYEHSIGVGFIAKNYFDEIVAWHVANGEDKRVVEELLAYEVPFKIAAPIHDIGHIALSHLAEKAKEGHDNDENLMWMLESETSEIHQYIVNNFGEDVLEKVKEIIGHKHFLYKALKDCDRMEYQGFGDFVAVNNPRLKFYKASVDDVKKFARTVRFFTLPNGEIELGYTESGALQKFLREYARQLSHKGLNKSPLRVAESELPICIGLAANRAVNSENIMTMTEEEMCNAAAQGASTLNGTEYRIDVDIQAGDKAYSGYSPYDMNNKIWVVNGKTQDVLDYIEEEIRDKNRSLYDLLHPMITTLRTPTLLRIEALISNKF